MSRDEQIEFKQALVKLKRLNESLTISSIAFIAGVSAKTVESWLYDDGRAPSFGALTLVYDAIVLSKGFIPREANRLVGRHRARARRWAKKHPAGNEKPLLIGEKIPPARKKISLGPDRYIYHGASLSLPKIAGASEVPYATAYYRVVRNGKCSAGEDVTSIIDAPDGRGRSSR